MEGSAEARCNQAVPWHQSGREGISRWQLEGPAVERRRMQPFVLRIPLTLAELPAQLQPDRTEEGSCLHVSPLMCRTPAWLCKLQGLQGFPPGQDPEQEH